MDISGFFRFQLDVPCSIQINLQNSIALLLFLVFELELTDHLRQSLKMMIASYDVCDVLM